MNFISSKVLHLLHDLHRYKEMMEKEGGGDTTAGGSPSMSAMHTAAKQAELAELAERAQIEKKEKEKQPPKKRRKTTKTPKPTTPQQRHDTKG